MKAIATKYHPATNHRGARITARDCDGNQVTISYDYGMNDTDQHHEALKALVEKKGWDVDPEQFVGGEVQKGMVWVHSNLVCTTPRACQMRKADKQASIERAVEQSLLVPTVPNPDDHFACQLCGKRTKYADKWTDANWRPTKHGKTELHYCEVCYTEQQKLTKLHRYGDQEPDCPVCTGGNAMLPKYNQSVQGWDYECRDCGKIVPFEKANIVEYEFDKKTRLYSTLDQTVA
jgi:DNA-directed RNA polymerase subunit M/transcription elongation factor TFIIS